MELFEVLVGYTAAQADDIRKEIDKLNRAKNTEGRKRLNARHEEFIVGATDVLGSEEIAEELWLEILPYTGYAFNRPHAGSYSTQAYQDAWLKKHYPTFSYAVYLTLDEKKTALYLREARKFGVSVRPPDINASGSGFTSDLVSNSLRYGLRGINGIGDAAANQILADRPFTSMEDFTTRSSRKYSKVNSKARRILLEVGALDCFGGRDDWEPKQRAQAELDLIGVALEPGGVLGDDDEFVRSNVYTEQEIDGMNSGDRVIVAGKVIELKKTRVKRGKSAGRSMAYGKVALDLDHYGFTLWPETWDVYSELFESGEMLMIVGKLDSSKKVIVREAMLLSDFVSELRQEQEVSLAS